MSITLGGTSPAVTFPDATVQDTSAIVGGKVPYTNLPAGSVLQVVQGSINATATSASSTYANTGLTATITPKFSTSKILVLLTLQGVGKDTGNTSVNLRIQRAASTIITFTNSFTGYTGSGATFYPGSSAFNYLDSPATTSATTYTLQLASDANVANAYVSAGNTYSTITLLEIAQ